MGPGTRDQAGVCGGFSAEHWRECDGGRQTGSGLQEASMVIAKHAGILVLSDCIRGTPGSSDRGGYFVTVNDELLIMPITSP
jgi:hypothetical protein